MPALLLVGAVAFVLLAGASAVLGRFAGRFIGASRLAVVSVFLGAAVLFALVHEAGGLLWMGAKMISASDATGPLIDNAQVTAHGWGTALRRALFECGLGGLMGVAFAAVEFSARSARSLPIRSDR